MPSFSLDTKLDLWQYARDKLHRQCAKTVALLARRLDSLFASAVSAVPFLSTSQPL